MVWQHPTVLQKNLEDVIFLRELKSFYPEYQSQDWLNTEVYLGKLKYECGQLCDFDAINLEIHLVTCEIYQCDNCKIKFKSIRDIKEHIEEKQ